MRFEKWSALLPPLIVVAGWTDLARAQGTNDVFEARPPTYSVIEEGGPGRVRLASGILTFGSADDDAAIVATGSRRSAAEQAFGPFAILDSLFNPDKVTVPRKRTSSTSIHLSPAAMGAGGYGMLATATF